MTTTAHLHLSQRAVADVLSSLAAGAATAVDMPPLKWKIAADTGELHGEPAIGSDIPRFKTLTAWADYLGIALVFGPDRDGVTVHQGAGTVTTRSGAQVTVTISMRATGMTAIEAAVADVAAAAG